MVKVWCKAEESDYFSVVLHPDEPPYCYNNIPETCIWALLSRKIPEKELGFNNDITTPKFHVTQF